MKPDKPQEQSAAEPPRPDHGQNTKRQQLLAQHIDRWIEAKFCVAIHESADVEAAQRFWEEVTDAPAGQFTRPALKRHNPKTNRKNVGNDYHGCLRVSVHRSSTLYRRIEGWASAVTATA